MFGSGLQANKGERRDEEIDSKFFFSTPLRNGRLGATIAKASKSPPNHGGIAQLVERLLCKQDVSGSSPLTST